MAKEGRHPTSIQHAVLNAHLLAQYHNHPLARTIGDAYAKVIAAFPFGARLSSGLWTSSRERMLEAIQPIIDGYEQEAGNADE